MFASFYHLAMRTKSIYPLLWLILAALLLVSVAIVYVHYQRELDRIEQDIQDVKKETNTIDQIK